MRRLCIALSIVAGLFSSASVAQENKTVVELYTSQGCSSCPPADALLTQLAKRDDVIALALHVDYWDYIGWKDSFGSPAFTARQHNYARAASATTVYTPQMVIGGVDHVIGSKPMEVADHLRAQQSQAKPLMLTLRQSGGQVQVTAAPFVRRPTAMIVQLVRYLPSETVAIRRGENAGKSIEYSNIVRSWQNIARWDGTSALNISADVPGTDAVVVIVQQDGFGPIVAAAELR